MLGQIGCAFRELGRHNEALRMMERALDFRRRTLHKNHPDIATSMSNLAAIYGESGRYGEALRMDQETLAVRRTLRKDDPAIGDTLNNLAITYSELGRLRRRTLHKNHPDIATSMSNLAAMYGELRRYDEALWFSLEALKRLRGRLPHDHPDIAAKNSRIVRFAPPQSRKTRCSVASFSMLYSLNARPSSSCFPAKISPCYSRSCASTMVTPSDDDSDFVPYACRKFELALDAAVEGLTAISVNDLNLK